MEDIIQQHESSSSSVETTNISETNKSNVQTNVQNNTTTNNSNSDVVSQQQSTRQTTPIIPTTTATTTQTTITPTPAAVAPNSSLDISTYLSIYNHAIRCTQIPCTVHSRCIQFRRIMHHARHCIKYKMNECNICRQLVALTIIHAKSCRDDNCPAPYCGSIKVRLDELNETMRARVESAYEYVRTSVGLLAYTPKRSQALQTIHEHTDDATTTTLENHTKMECDDENGPVGDDDHDCESIEQERAKLMAEIERVKEMDTTSSSTLSTNRPNRLRMDVKFSKELAKHVFKQLMDSHELANKCYSSVQFAQLARKFMLENLNLMGKISMSASSSSSSSMTATLTDVDLDNYLVLVVDLAHRFDRMLAKHGQQRRTVECQTVTTSVNAASGGGEKKRDREWEEEEEKEKNRDDVRIESLSSAKKIRAV